MTWPGIEPRSHGVMVNTLPSRLMSRLIIYIYIYTHTHTHTHNLFINLAYILAGYVNDTPDKILKDQWLKNKKHLKRLREKKQTNTNSPNNSFFLSSLLPFIMSYFKANSFNILN